MYSFLHNLLRDKKDGEIFTLYNLSHFFYIALTLSVIILLMILLRNREKSQKKVTRVLINIAFGAYIADFFLMPIAYGEIDIEKLPFHACTAMCVMCFLSHRVPFLEKYKSSFAMLGFISNFIYLIYPAGVMWHAVHPTSYRVIQTLLFHSIMTVYCFLSLVYDELKMNVKRSCRDLITLSALTAWATLGNYVYNGSVGEYSHFFNWFFVVRDPFYIIPEAIAPFVMPFLNVILFFSVATAVRFALSCFNKNSNFLH